VGLFERLQLFREVFADKIRSYRAKRAMPISLAVVTRHSLIVII